MHALFSFIQFLADPASTLKASFATPALDALLVICLVGAGWHAVQKMTEGREGSVKGVLIESVAAAAASIALFAVLKVFIGI